MDYKDALGKLGELSKILNEAASKEDNLYRYKKLRLTQRKLRDEIHEIVISKLQQSSTKYKARNERFKTAKSDLEWVRKKADSFRISAAKLSKLVGLATKFIPLLL